MLRFPACIRQANVLADSVRVVGGVGASEGERLKGNEMQRYQKEELGQRASRWRELSRPTRFFQVDALVVGMIGNAIKRLPHSVVFFGEREGLDGGVYFEKQGLGAFVHRSCGSCSDGKVRGQMSARTTHSTFTQQQLTSRHMVQTKVFFGWMKAEWKVVSASVEHKLIDLCVGKNKSCKSPFTQFGLIMERL